MMPLKLHKFYVLEFEEIISLSNHMMSSFILVLVNYGYSVLSMNQVCLSTIK